MKNLLHHRLLLLSVTTGLIASCGGSSDPTLSPAKGVTIDEIAVFQSVKRTLVKGGKVATSTIPLIAGRDTLIRVHYKTDSTYDQKEVTARLTIDGTPPAVVDQKLTLVGQSAQKDLQTTINFYPNKSLIQDPLNYSVEVLQEGGEAQGSAGARHPATGYSTVKVEGQKNTFRLLLVPFKYKADGSNRLPDTSAAQLKKFKERFLQLYPVSDVEITLHAPIEWDKAIGATGSGWQEVGLRLLQVRTESNVSDDTYMYGFFNPAATLQAYCGWGCMLGVTLLNSTPADKGIVSLRLALGVGFTDRATDTAAHEIGHSHGRKHANCGPGLSPSSIDASYPDDTAHKGGKIGVWGFDMITKQLVPPTYSDIMGYCDQKWISDYNFTAFWNRGKNVNLAMTEGNAGGTFAYDLISVDLDGRAEGRWTRPVTRRRQLVSGETLPVILDGGKTVRGELFRFDHLPAAWLFVPQSRASHAAFSVDGRAFEIQR